QDAGPVLKSAEQATAYAELGFEKNIDNLVFGGTNFSTKTNVTGEGDVITLTFGTDGLEPGLYNVVFVGDTVEIYTVGMNQVVPETTNGWIRILAPDETPEPTEEPTEAPTEEPTEPETDAPTEPETEAPTEPETEAPTEPETEAPTEPETDAPTEPETDAPTEPETDAPTEPETDAPTEAPTEPETENIVAPAWIIGTTEVYAGEDAVIAVSVNGDTTGLNSYIVRLSQDAGPVLKSAEQATAYAELGFEKNIDALVFGGTNFSTKTNVTGEGDVITLTFGTDGLEPGLYNVVFVGDTVEIYTVGMNQVVPETTNGWIRILAPDETPAPTEEPTEAPTEEPTEPETDAPTEPETDAPTEPETDAPTEPETDAPTEPETDAPTEPETDAPTEPETDAPTEPETDEPTQAPTDEPTEAEPAKWIIGTTEVYAGEDAVIAVSVTNDTVGLNSYVVRLTQDAGPVLKSAEQATAYAELGFEKNLETMVFGGTSFGSEENIIGNGDVITLTFDTTGVEPGLYNVRFVDGTVEIYDVAMNPLVPETEDGWIRILAPDETLAPTEEPTEAPTEEPTEAPTEEPTEEPATDEPTQEPATDEPTQEPATDEPTQEPATDEPTQEPATDEPTQEPATDEPTQEPATDEPTQEPATDEPTQGPTDGPNDTFTVKWDIGDVTAKAGEEVLVPITISGADPGLNNFSFTIKTDDGISYVGYTDENGVFHDMIQITNPEGLTFEGVSVVGGNVAGEDGDVILNLRFTVPEDAVPGTVYAIDFDGAVTATRADGTPVEVITEGGSITVLPNDIGVVGYRYRITGKHHFYFAHDVRPFNPADLINTIYYSELYGQVDENGDPILDADGNIQYVDEETQNDLTNWTKYDMASDSNITFTFADEWASPKTVYDREVLPRVTLGKEGTKAFHVQRVPVQITLNGVTTSQELGLAYIGVKGDTSLNGFSNANDAAFVLRYAAAYGAKRDVSSFFLNGTPVYLDENMSEVVSNEDMESFVYFLSDVTAESEDHGKTSAAGDTSGNPALNANDASFILLWAAKVGAKLDPNWGKDVLTKPIPKYTQEINDYIDAHPELG
ncbi:MAG: hypothetical protein IJ055_09885, partial [Oscillospiraceae bacterium]|nr:hypothetical protein [Oscillospiraceae bacterium]